MPAKLNQSSQSQLLPPKVTYEEAVTVTKRTITMTVEKCQLSPTEGTCSKPVLRTRHLPR